VNQSLPYQSNSFQIKGNINIIYYSQQPGKIICQVAKEDKCSLIVIGCRDAEPGKLRRYGETVDYVMKKADCPVVLARRKTVPGARESRPRSGSQSISTGIRRSASRVDDKVADYNKYRMGRRASIA